MENAKNITFWNIGWKPAHAGSSQKGKKFMREEILADRLKNHLNPPIFLTAKKIFFSDPPKSIPAKFSWNVRPPKNAIHMKYFPLPFIQNLSLFSTKLLNLKLVILGIRQNKFLLNMKTFLIRKNRFRQIASDSAHERIRQNFFPPKFLPLRYL